MSIAWRILFIAAIAALTGCANTARKADYSQFRTESPRSILVVPVINRSVDVNAPDYFLSTIAEPLAERGYYVFPLNMVKSVMADDGLSDANLVHSGDPRRLGELFGADAVMYISIDRWDAKYVVLATTVTVELTYVIKSAHTGQQLWSNHQQVVYQPRSGGGGGLGGLLADVITAAVAKASPNYMPLARQANAQAINLKGTGLPAGPYDGLFGRDGSEY